MADIDNMSAGPELDALVAERVMRWTKHEHHPMPLLGTGRHWKRADGTTVERWHTQPGYGEDECWPFSSDIAAAGEVLEQSKLLDDDGGDFMLWHDLDGWIVGDTHFMEFARGETGPLALSRAACKAVEKGGG